MNVLQTSPIAAAPAAPKPVKPDPKLVEATRQFEAFFVGYLMKEMRKGGVSAEGSGILAPSNGEKMFRDMLDDENAKHMSQTGQLGLADLMIGQLTAAEARKNDAK